MTFEDFKKKYKSDPRFRKEKTDNFTDFIENPLGISPKRFASLIKSKHDGKTNSRQVKDKLKDYANFKQEFIKENEDLILDILENR